MLCMLLITLLKVKLSNAHLVPLVDQLLVSYREADIEEASSSEESVDLYLEDSETEENEVSELEPFELQDTYNE